jgi:antitoxin (DNA-binding transcriptional repressor) of toxin-antitoxin stability system
LWSKEAVYETGALGILKGFRDASGRFGRTVPITKEEAVAIAYRAAGREAEAQQFGNALNNSRAQANKKTDPLEVLYDGFLQLAANEGLISIRNLADALNADQTTLEAGSFNRKSPAQRQEMIYWLARTLNIQPEGIQQEVLNYTDWRSTDPDKLPYVEALLRKGIVSGSNNRINPTQSITREQCAQIVKNAEDDVLSAVNYVKNFGIIEKITSTRNYTSDVVKAGKEIYITNANGSYSMILTTAQAGTASGGRNENAGGVLRTKK